MDKKKSGLGKGKLKPKETKKKFVGKTALTKSE